MSEDTFIKDLKIKDHWTVGPHSYRLVNYGAGPDVLEILGSEGWKLESKCYVLGVLTSRVYSLTKITELEKAIKVLQKNLSEDSEYYMGWEANIAMSFFDAYYQNKKDYKNRGDIHGIANKAANQFIHNLCRNGEHVKD